MYEWMNKQNKLLGYCRVSMQLVLSSLLMHGWRFWISALTKIYPYENVPWFPFKRSLLLRQGMLIGKLLFTLNSDAWFVHVHITAWTKGTSTRQQGWSWLLYLSTLSAISSEFFSFSAKIISSMDSSEETRSQKEEAQSLLHAACCRKAPAMEDYR